MTPPEKNPRISSMGELAIRRPLKRTAAGEYAPGQTTVTFLDPHPHRDRADLVYKRCEDPSFDSRGIMCVHTKRGRGAGTPALMARKR